MKDWANFFSDLIEKFDIKKLMICAFVVLALMLVPKISFLGFIMPLDNAEKWIMFIFALITTYIALSILIYLWQCLKDYFKYKPKNLFWMMGKYGDCINIFYSEEIDEYSASVVDLYNHRVPEDIINKLHENKIIECGGYNHYFNYPTYRLTRKARKKLTRMRKTINFIDSKFINKNKTVKSKNE